MKKLILSLFLVSAIGSGSELSASPAFIFCDTDEDCIIPVNCGASNFCEDSVDPNENYRPCEFSADCTLQEQCLSIDMPEEEGGDIININICQ